MIEINVYGPFKEIVGQKTIQREVGDGDSVSSVLRSLASEYPELSEHLFENDTLRDSINVHKNGKNIKLGDGGETTVEPGDQLSMTVSLEGG